MSQNKNRFARLKDVERIYRVAEFESNLTVSAVATIISNMLIDKGIFAQGEVEAYLSEDKIREMRELIRGRIIETKKEDAEAGHATGN